MAVDVAHLELGVPPPVPDGQVVRQTSPVKHKVVNVPLVANRFVEVA